MLDSESDDAKKAEMLRFQDSDLNTALHFGAKNGNWKICDYIITTATKLGMEGDIIHLTNKTGFTPLLEVSFRGFHLENKKEQAADFRYKIIEKLLMSGADPNFARERTNMTSLHWLAYNDDKTAVNTLLNLGADHLIFSHSLLLPIDVAGTTPSLAVVDCLLEHFTKVNQLPEYTSAMRY